MAEGLKDADVVMMLRLQRERMAGAFVPSVREYFRYFGLDAEKLKAAKPDALVMHPGPMNRGVEIASEIADGPQSVIQEQVEMGVAVRMAVMEALLDPRRNTEGAPHERRRVFQNARVVDPVARHRRKRQREQYVLVEACSRQKKCIAVRDGQATANSAPVSRYAARSFRAAAWCAG